MAKKKDGGAGASKKTEQKKKKQVIEDKTFGLKNKNKSKKVCAPMSVPSWMLPVSTGIY